MVVAGNDQSSVHRSLDSAVEAASDMDRAGSEDAIQVVDSTGEIVLQGGELTDRIIEHRNGRKGARAVP